MTQTPGAPMAPFRLSPYFQTRIWGFQSLEPWYDQVAQGEPLGEVWLTGEKCLAQTGPNTGRSLNQIFADSSQALLGAGFASESGFPLLIKMLFPKEKLSVQVHPDDSMAQKYGEPRGKTECWYALSAEPGAKVACGIRPGTTPEEMRARIADSTLEEVLEWLPVTAGDMIYVDAGTVHAIGPGAVILETQQTCDITYRLYDYGRPRELHLDRSFEAMRLTTSAGKVQPQRAADRTILVDATYFRVEKLDPFQRAASAQLGPQGEMSLLFVSNGSARIEPAVPGAFEPFELPRATLAVIPASSPDYIVTNQGELELIRILARRGE